MSYSGKRDLLEDTELADDIKKFVASFVQNTADPASRRTIILFPGGMGSELKRGNKANTAAASPPQEKFHTRWLTLDTFVEGVDELQMIGDVDYEEKFVIPRGAIELCGVNPYDNFTKWCKRNKFDLFIFGYDWRRRPEYSVRFFLDDFLPLLQSSVSAAGNFNLFDDLTLIGHSLGGMTTKLIMQDASPLATKIKRAITVGTPFYGYGGQTLRYFEGESEFLLQSKSDLTKIISSLQGGYFLQFLDLDTFNHVATALQADPHYPLDGYPSTDSLTGKPADPFNPDDAPPLFRYPAYVNTSELPYAKTSYQSVAQDLQSAVAARFFNIRVVQRKGGQDLLQTYVAQKWSRVPATFNPDAQHIVPIAYAKGPGDGTIPAWSARLVSLAQDFPDNVVTLRGDLEHMSLMESDAVQNQIYNFLGLPP